MRARALLLGRGSYSDSYLVGRGISPQEKSPKENLSLLTAISLEEMKRSWDETWPDVAFEGPVSGYLLFWHDLENPRLGLDPFDLDGMAVTHSSHRPDVDRQIHIGFQSIVSEPSDIRMDDDETDSRYEDYLNYRKSLVRGPLHQLFGYPVPHTTLDSPEDVCVEMARYVFQKQSNPEDWMLLLSLVEDPDLGWHFHESKGVSFYILKEDFARHRFDRVWALRI